MKKDVVVDIDFIDLRNVKLVDLGRDERFVVLVWRFFKRNWRYVFVSLVTALVVGLVLK